MLVISLDEYGEFEGLNSRQSVVAGTVFDCKWQDQLEREQVRIADYLWDVCERCGAEFPADLHPMFKGNGEISNQDRLSRVQAELERTFAQFLADSKNGTYYLYLLVSERMGVSKFEDEDAGNLLRDSFAGNRYLHMSQMAIRNLVINNPKLQSNKYALHLATRTLMNQAIGRELEREASQLGMVSRQEWKGSSSKVWRMSDVNSYISALSAAVMEDERENVDFQLQVESIKYDKEDFERNERQAFMMLADIVCDLVKKELLGEKDHRAHKLLDRLNQFTTHQENMVWCYHDVDFKLRKAMRYMIDGQPFQSLQQLYAIESEDSDQAAFYREHWVGTVLEQLQQRKDPNKIAEAARRLMDRISKPNADMGESRYIAEQLLALTEQENDRYGLCNYLLGSCMLTLCNHAGQHEQAEQWYQKCEKYAVSAPLDEYLELRNAYAVALIDRLVPEKALSITLRTVQLEEKADEIRRQAFGCDEAVSLHHGRSLSQLGQCYSYLQQYEKAEECFLQALKAFENSPVDRQITRSYLLHCYIEAPDKRKYAELAAQYFGSGDSKKQLDGIYEMENTTFPYALLVYLKGWYRLNPDSFPAKLTGSLLKGVLEKGTGKSGHPWELIWKYVALLAGAANRPEVAEEAIRRLTEFRDRSEGLLRQICDDGLASCQAGKETGKMTYMHR